MVSINNFDDIIEIVSTKLNINSGPKGVVLLPPVASQLKFSIK